MTGKKIVHCLLHDQGLFEHADFLFVFFSPFLVIRCLYKNLQTGQPGFQFAPFCPEQNGHMFEKRRGIRDKTGFGKNRNRLFQIMQVAETVKALEKGIKEVVSVIFAGNGQNFIRLSGVALVQPGPL